MQDKFQIERERDTVTAKENIIKYLSRVLFLDVEIQNKEKELAELQKDPSRLQGIDFEAHIRTGGTKDPVSSILENIAKLEIQINAELQRLIGLKQNIHNLIESVEDDVYRIILQKKYIHGESDKKIGDCIGFSERHIARLHNRALEKICCIMQTCQQMSLNVKDDDDKM